MTRAEIMRRLRDCRRLVFSNLSHRGRLGGEYRINSSASLFALCQLVLRGLIFWCQIVPPPDVILAEDLERLVC